MTIQKRVLAYLTIFAFLGAIGFLIVPLNVQSTTTTPALFGTNVPTADSTANNVSADVVGNKSDAAAAGAVTTTESLMAYAKQTVTDVIASDTVVDSILVDTGTTIPATITTAQNDLDVITGASGVNLLTATQASIDAIEVDTGTTLPATLAAMPQTVLKADGAVLTGNDDLFVVAGGPVRCTIVGVVTTLVGANATNGDLQIITTSPAATLDLNTAPVAFTDDAAGTIYYSIGATSVFTPSATLGGVILDPVTVQETGFILTPGTVHFRSSAANDGVIAWYMTYTPLSPLSTVTAAP